jgi:hypothetical protein
MRMGKTLKKGLVALVLCLAAAGLVVGCSGSDSGKAVQKTVDDVTGKTTVEAGNLLKKQINDITGKEVEKVQKDAVSPTGDGESEKAEGQ